MSLSLGREIFRASDLLKFIFSFEIYPNVLKFSYKFVIEMCDCVKKNNRSLAYAAILNSLPAILKPWMEVFWLTKLIKGSGEIINNSGESGQPYLVLFFIFMPMWMHID